ncbi:MAG: hypothetical protein PHW93_02410 [Candidatus Methanomethylophilaceae archaeon]|nr:hypothetical protein [Candidatus Methanomethylophilaceae archaeon]
MTPMQVNGTPSPHERASGVLRIAGGMLLAFIGVLLLWQEPDPTQWLFFLVAAGMALVLMLFAPILAGVDRRDSWPLYVDTDGIRLPLSTWQRIVRHQDAFRLTEIDHIIIRHVPTDYGYEPHSLILCTRDGRTISSGAKEAEGLREAVTLLQKAGIRVEDIK